MTGIFAMAAALTARSPLAASISALTSNSAVSGTTAIAQYDLRADGDIYTQTTSNALINRGSWLSPKVGMGGYSAFVTVKSGTLTSGPTGGWMNLGTNQTWQIQQPIVATKNCVITVKIRNDATGAECPPVDITLNAQRVS